MLKQHPSDLCISAVTLAELNYGAEKKRSQKIRGAIRAFTMDVAILPVDARAAERFGVVAVSLATRGEPIGLYDTIVAAHALSLGVVLVTNNVRHFSRVPGLAVENWA